MFSPTSPGLNELVPLFTNLIRSLVDDPDAVDVHALEGTHSTLFEVSVAPDDVRRVIGRKGRTADALREVLTSWGGRAGRRMILEVMDPGAAAPLTCRPRGSQAG